MNKKIKISHTKNITRARVRNSLNNELMDILVKFGLIESHYDKELYKEGIEIIKLHYEKYSKWIILHNTSVLAFLTLFVTYQSLFFGIMFAFSLIQAVRTNIKVNISFNTLLKKQKEL